MTWKPTMLDPRMVGDRAELGRLTRQPAVRLCDRLRDQLAELVRAGQPNCQLSSLDEAVAISDRLDGIPALEYGSWFYYPWSGALVHVLPVAEFRSLRTGHTRLTVLPLDQERLSKARIAVAGLSVGLAAATTLVLEGVGGRFALADSDALSLADLNRCSAPVSDLGINKAVLAARRLLELDPYLHVEIFPEGVTDANIDAFLGSWAPGLSLLVEECDDQHARIRLRERARELRLPVLMATSDGGSLDIERFDLDPRLEMPHELVAGHNAHGLRGMATKDKGFTVGRILGHEHVSSPTAASLVENGQTASTWPRLASGVWLGGARLSDAVRGVLLGTDERKEAAWNACDNTALRR